MMVTKVDAILSWLAIMAWTYLGIRMFFALWPTEPILPFAAVLATGLLVLHAAIRLSEYYKMGKK